ncbi:MAG: MBOAT family protein [Eubacterium sp.]|nr:MBOAT family protein [Eubacterium sp.]
MVFNSFDFLLFFPIVVVLYFVIPRKFQKLWLLLASYYFYMSWNPKYIILIVFVTIVTYAGGIGINIFEKENGRVQYIGKKVCLIGSIFANLLILFFFKYADLAIGYLNKILEIFHVEVINKRFDYLLPVGISFFTFQAIGYVIDVYRGETKAEKNILQYALFIAFFPQLVAGPIERSKNLLKQMSQIHKFDYERVKNGLLLMLWGFFLKVVVADRIALFVDVVYENPYGANGFFIVVATVLFAFQIYCDFYGYSTIARGGARVLGFELMENFTAPYLALDTADFWRRWHISLSGWFRDYLYIPLGGNRKGKVRKYVNLLIVFLASGLWHGASLAFVIWGGMNGVYQIVGDICKPLKKRLAKVFSYDLARWEHRCLCHICTFVLVDISWLFFRAGDIGHAVTMIKQMIGVYNPEIFVSGALYEIGLSRQEFWVMLISIVIVLWVDSLHNRGLHVLEMLEHHGIIYRTLAVGSLICAVVILGVYGGNQDVSTFIYFTF